MGETEDKSDRETEAELIRGQRLGGKFWPECLLSVLARPLD